MKIAQGKPGTNAALGKAAKTKTSPFVLVWRGAAVAALLCPRLLSGCPFGAPEFRISGGGRTAFCYARGTVLPIPMSAAEPIKVRRRSFAASKQVVYDG
jgi:hypothetical protein